MPRSRDSEVPQRQSTRGPSHLRTSSSNSDPLHPRLTTPRSPKLGDRRSPRGAQSDPVNKKKLGTRISDLESRLGEAQDELKNLKEQLVSAEAAKKEAQEELEKKVKKPIAKDPEDIQVNHTPKEIESNENETTHLDEITEEIQLETDVFEVPMEIVSVEPNANFRELTDDQEAIESKPVISTDPPAASEQEKLSCNDLVLKDDKINLLEAKLMEKEKELEVLCQENEVLKKDLAEATTQILSARTKEEETDLKLIQLGDQLEASKVIASQLNKKLEAAEGAKETLEAEMKKLRVQTEQWRKAADAAAAVLAGDVDMKGRRISERCGSMDKHIGGLFEPLAGGYAGFVGSPGIADGDDGYGNGNGKRKGSGIKMFGDLWKKKGQK